MDDQQYSENNTWTPILGIKTHYPGRYGAGKNTEPSSKELRHAVLVDYLQFIPDGAMQKNKCISQTLADGARTEMNFHAGHDWYGPIIVRSASHYDNASLDSIIKKRRQQAAGIQTLKDEGNYYRDITWEDFQFFVDHLSVRGADLGTWEREYTKFMWKETETDPALLAVANADFSNHNRQIISAAKISCLGETNFLYRELFIKADIGFGHPIYQSEAVEFSKMIGLPLLLCPSESKPRGSEINWRSQRFLDSKKTLAFNPYENHLGRYLNLELNSASLGWGNPNAQDRFDTILIARQDRKPLELQHIESLAMFCVYSADKMTLQRHEENKHPWDVMVRARDDFMLFSMCRESFETFFEAYKRSQVAAGRVGWENAVSPFDA